MVKGEEEPEYLRKVRKMSKWERVLRFRMGEGMYVGIEWMIRGDIVVCRFEVENYGHWMGELVKRGNERGQGMATP